MRLYNAVFDGQDHFVLASDMGAAEQIVAQWIKDDDPENWAEPEEVLFDEIVLMDPNPLVLMKQLEGGCRG